MTGTMKNANLIRHQHGSFAYGKPKPDSDVDLLVIMESDKSAHARSVQISEILYPRPFPVDMIVRTPAELSERLVIAFSKKF